MTTQSRQHNGLKDTEVSVQTKLAALWTSLMFIYLYVDYFHLYMPGSLEDLLKAKVFVFDITQGFLLTVSVSMTIPALMIFLSVALPAKVNRWTNLITAAIFIPFTLFNLVGVAWIHMVVTAIVEVALLCLVIRYAWKWPRI